MIEATWIELDTSNVVMLRPEDDTPGSPAA